MLLETKKFARNTRSCQKVICEKPFTKPRLGQSYFVFAESRRLEGRENRRETVSLHATFNFILKKNPTDLTNRFNISSSSSSSTFYQWNPCSAWTAQGHPCEDAAVSRRTLPSRCAWKKSPICFRRGVVCTQATHRRSAKEQEKHRPFKSSTKREIRKFYFVIVQWRKKCTSNCDSRAVF